MKKERKKSDFLTIQFYFYFIDAFMKNPTVLINLNQN